MILWRYHHKYLIFNFFASTLLKLYFNKNYFPQYPKYSYVLIKIWHLEEYIIWIYNKDRFILHLFIRYVTYPFHYFHITISSRNEDDDMSRLLYIEWIISNIWQMFCVEENIFVTGWEKVCRYRPPHYFSDPALTSIPNSIYLRFIRIINRPLFLFFPFFFFNISIAIFFFINIFSRYMQVVPHRTYS